MESPMIVVTDIGVVTNAILPLFKVPTGFGGITLVEGQVTFLTAGTAGIEIVNGGADGTATTGATAGTVLSGGTAYTAKTPKTLSMVSAGVFFDEGEYVCLKENNTGSTVTVTEIALSFKWGK